jgi:muconate cycloisomerase
MKITKVTTFRVSVPVRPSVAITSSLGSHRISDYCLVRIETDDGIIGAGEATVTAIWSGETGGTAKLLIDEVLGPAVIGADPRDIDDVLGRMEAVAFGLPFTKGAIETACWDIAGKTASKPMWQLLGDDVNGAVLPSRFSVSSRDQADTVRIVREQLDAGFRAFKLKVGVSAESDVARYRAVRAEAGADVMIGVDGNGGMNAEQSIALAEALAGDGLAFLEQPVPRDRPEVLAEIQQQVDVPVMADESVFTLAEAERVAELGAAQVVSVYPGKNGGISRCREIIAMLADFDIPCVIGSNLELDVATAAVVHMIRATENVLCARMPGDLVGPYYHERSIVRRPVRIERGQVHVPDGPGLGVEVAWNEL